MFLYIIYATTPLLYTHLYTTYFIYLPPVIIFTTHAPTICIVKYRIPSLCAVCCIERLIFSGDISLVYNRLYAYTHIVQIERARVVNFAYIYIMCSSSSGFADATLRLIHLNHPMKGDLHASRPIEMPHSYTTYIYVTHTQTLLKYYFDSADVRKN